MNTIFKFLDWVQSLIAPFIDWATRSPKNFIIAAIGFLVIYGIGTFITNIRIKRHNEEEL